MTRGLSPDDIALILTSPLPGAALARQLGVTHQTISDVRNHKTHKHVRPELPRTNHFTTRKLKPEQVAYIQASSESLLNLSKRFNVSRRTIFSVKRRETYKSNVRNMSCSSPHLECSSCKYWSFGCQMGFPESAEDLSFAAECALFSPGNSP